MSACYHKRDNWTDEGAIDISCKAIERKDAIW